MNISYRQILFCSTSTESANPSHLQAFYVAEIAQVNANGFYSSCLLGVKVAVLC